MDAPKIYVFRLNLVRKISKFLTAVRKSCILHEHVFVIIVIGTYYYNLAMQHTEILFRSKN